MRLRMQQERDGLLPPRSQQIQAKPTQNSNVREGKYEPMAAEIQRPELMGFARENKENFKDFDGPS